MSLRGYLGKVFYRVGYVFDGNTDKSFERQTDAWQKEAECGCGINCCEKEFVLTDKTTGEFIALYWIDGAMKFRRADGSVHTVTSVAD